MKDFRSSVLNGLLQGKKVKVDHDTEVEQAECLSMVAQNKVESWKDGVFTVNLNLN